LVEEKRVPEKKGNSEGKKGDGSAKGRLIQALKGFRRERDSLGWI